MKKIIMNKIKYKMCLFKTSWVILSYSQNTRTTYIIFKAYKKIIKYLFSIYKNDKQILSKAQRKTPKKSTWKVPRSFRGRKRQKAKKGWERYRDLTKEEKEKGIIRIFLSNKIKSLLSII